MKIVCDACQAKYSISDDKVQGKVFKIRCKKCSNIIVVRGGAGAAEPAPAPAEKDTRVYDYGYEGGGGEAPAGDDAVWHLVINQDQVGPMTVAEVQQRFAAGEVDSETFAWREGFADWLPLSQVEPFTALVASGTTTAAHGGGGGGAAAIGAMFGSSADEGGGTSRSDPGDLFASAGVSARAADDDDGGDLFGSKPAAQSASAGAANSKLRGERNENSVLFSLNNLAQLASDKPAMSAPSGGGGGGGGGAGHATGAAGGEGSGLIDIRSMASAYMGGSGASMKPATSSAIGSIDDLPVFGGGGFSEPAVIVPTARPAGNNKVLYLMIGAVSLLAVVAIIMVVMLMKSGNKEKPPVVADNGVAAKPEVAKEDKAATDTTPDQKAADGSAKAPDTAADTKKPDTTATDTKKPDTTATSTTDTKKPDPKTTTTAPTHNTVTAPTHNTVTAPTHNTVTATTKTTSDPKTTTKTDTKTDTGGGGACDEVSCVLNNYEGACCSKFRKGGAPKTGGGGDKPKASGGGDLPDALDRGMISGGIANVKARVTSCGDKSQAKGKVKVHVKVGGDGRVANVSVESSPDPALGACVAAAVSKANFGKTQNGGSFSYPFVF